jgi:hypothetical protein
MTIELLNRLSREVPHVPDFDGAEGDELVYIVDNAQLIDFSFALQTKISTIPPSLYVYCTANAPAEAKRTEMSFLPDNSLTPGPLIGQGSWQFGARNALRKGKARATEELSSFGLSLEAGDDAQPEVPCTFIGAQFGRDVLKENVFKLLNKVDGKIAPTYDHGTLVFAEENSRAT